MAELKPPFKRGDVVEDTRDGSIYITGDAKRESFDTRVPILITIFEYSTYAPRDGFKSLNADPLKLIGHIEVPDGDLP